MKIFEYGVLKDGRSRLAYMAGNLVNDDEVGPCLTNPVDQYDGGKVLGEIHDLDALEIKQRDWMYSAFKRETRRTVKGEKVQVYVLKRDPRGFMQASSTWLYPRQNGRVFLLETSDGARFEGSYREILEKLYLDQWTVDGRRRFKAEVARRIKLLGGRVIRIETLEKFFGDLRRARVVRLRQVWPRKILPNAFPN